MTHAGDEDSEGSSSFSFIKGGNIGMGLKDPSSNLHIYGDNNDSQILLGQSKNDNRSSIIEYSQGHAGTDGSGSLYIGHYDTEKKRVLISIRSDMLLSDILHQNFH